MFEISGSLCGETALTEPVKRGVFTGLLIVRHAPTPTLQSPGSGSEAGSSCGEAGPTAVLRASSPGASGSVWPQVDGDPRQEGAAGAAEFSTESQRVYLPSAAGREEQSAAGAAELPVQSHGTR